MFQYFLPSPIAVKVEVTGKVLDDEGDAEDDENDGERYCQDWYADIFFKTNTLKSQHGSGLDVVFTKHPPRYPDWVRVLLCKERLFPSGAHQWKSIIKSLTNWLRL